MKNSVSLQQPRCGVSRRAHTSAECSIYGTGFKLSTGTVQLRSCWSIVPWARIGSAGTGGSTKAH